MRSLLLLLAIWSSFVGAQPSQQGGEPGQFSSPPDSSGGSGRSGGARPSLGWGPPPDLTPFFRPNEPQKPGAPSSPPPAPTPRSGLEEHWQRQNEAREQQSRDDQRRRMEEDVQRQIEEERRYQEMQNQYSRNMDQYLKSRPTTQGEAKKMNQNVRAPLDLSLSTDAAEAAAMEAAGLGIVQDEYLTAGEVQKLMRSRGINVSSGDKENAKIFYDALANFARLQAIQDRSRIDAAKAQTEKMRADAQAVAQNAIQSAQEMGQVLGEFSNDALDEIPAEEAVVEINGEFAARSERVQDKIERIKPHSPQQTDLKNIAQRSLNAARDAARDLQQKDADWYLNVAEKTADLALGIDPVTGFYRSLVEATTGYNVITRERLSSFERGLAVFGVVTGGTSASIIRSARLLGKISNVSIRSAERIIQLAQVTRQSLPHVVKVMKKVGEYGYKIAGQPNARRHLDDIGRAIRKSHSEMVIKEFHTAEEINERFVKTSTAVRPVMSHTYGVSGFLKTDTVYIRFFDDKNSSQIGRYIVKASDIDYKNMTAEMIQQKLSLPFPPKFIGDVNLVKGTEVLKTQTSAVYTGSGGTTQYFILNDLDPSNFSNKRAL